MTTIKAKKKDDSLIVASLNQAYDYAKDNQILSNALLAAAFAAPILATAVAIRKGRAVGRAFEGVERGEKGYADSYLSALMKQKSMPRQNRIATNSGQLASYVNYVKANVPKGKGLRIWDDAILHEIQDSGDSLFEHGGNAFALNPSVVDRSLNPFVGIADYFNYTGKKRLPHDSLVVMPVSAWGPGGGKVLAHELGHAAQFEDPFFGRREGSSRLLGGLMEPIMDRTYWLTRGRKNMLAERDAWRRTGYGPLDKVRRAALGNYAAGADLEKAGLLSMSGLAGSMLIKGDADD